LPISTDTGIIEAMWIDGPSILVISNGRSSSKEEALVQKINKTAKKHRHGRTKINGLRAKNK
jgi:ribosomal silencing factor RsfS